jgi:hypothetical protein
MIVCGMLAGNPVPSIVARALVGLAGGFVLGSLAGWIGAHVVRENVVPPAGDGAERPSSGGAADGSAPAAIAQPGRPPDRTDRRQMRPPAPRRREQE